LKTVFIRLTKQGSKVHEVAAPVHRLAEIVEEYRLLGWDVSW
jgi:hypothetical protein